MTTRSDSPVSCDSSTSNRPSATARRRRPDRRRRSPAGRRRRALPAGRRRRQPSRTTCARGRVSSAIRSSVRLARTSWTIADDDVRPDDAQRHEGVDGPPDDDERDAQHEQDVVDEREDVLGDDLAVRAARRGRCGVAEPGCSALGHLGGGQARRRRWWPVSRRPGQCVGARGHADTPGGGDGLGSEVPPPAPGHLISVARPGRRSRRTSRSDRIEGDRNVWRSPFSADLTPHSRSLLGGAVAGDYGRARLPEEAQPCGPPSAFASGRLIHGGGPPTKDCGHGARPSQAGRLLPSAIHVVRMPRRMRSVVPKVGVEPERSGGPPLPSPQVTRLLHPAGDRRSFSRQRRTPELVDAVVAA